MAVESDVPAAVKEYNYSEFPPAENDAITRGFAELLKVGRPAPDFSATLLDDLSTVKLSDYIEKGLVLIEFGSLT